MVVVGVTLATKQTYLLTVQPPAGSNNENQVGLYIFMLVTSTVTAAWRLGDRRRKRVASLFARLSAKRISDASNLRYLKLELQGSTPGTD